MALFCGPNGGYLKISSALLNSKPMTFVAFVSHAEAAIIAAQTAVISIGSSGTANHYIALKWLGSTFGEWQVVSGSGSVNTTGKYMTQGLWLHVAAAFSSVSGTIFVDGEENESATILAMPSGLSTTIIGNAQNGASTNLAFNGYIAHAAIYNVNLSQQEIATLANGALPIQVRPANLISWVPGDFAHGFFDVKGHIWTPVNGIQIVPRMPPRGPNRLRSLLSRGNFVPPVSASGNASGVIGFGQTSSPITGINIPETSVFGLGNISPPSDSINIFPNGLSSFGLVGVESFILTGMLSSIYGTGTISALTPSISVQPSAVFGTAFIGALTPQITYAPFGLFGVGTTASVSSQDSLSSNSAAGTGLIQNIISQISIFLNSLFGIGSVSSPQLPINTSGVFGYGAVTTPSIGFPISLAPAFGLVNNPFASIAEILSGIFGRGAASAPSTSIGFSPNGIFGIGIGSLAGAEVEPAPFGVPGFGAISNPQPFVAAVPVGIYSLGLASAGSTFAGITENGVSAFGSASSPSSFFIQFQQGSVFGAGITPSIAAQPGGQSTPVIGFGAVQSPASALSLILLSAPAFGVLGKVIGQPPSLFSSVYGIGVLGKLSPHFFDISGQWIKMLPAQKYFVRLPAPKH